MVVKRKLRRSTVGKVLALSRAGIYDVPKEKFLSGFDLVHDSGGVVGGRSNAEKVSYEGGMVKVIGYEPLVELRRVHLGGGEFLDAVADFTGKVFPLGVGRLDEKGEPIYRENLTGEEFPVSFGGIDSDDYEDIKTEIKEAVEEGELPEEALSREPLEVIKELAQKEDGEKAVRAVSPTARKLIKRIAEKEGLSFKEAAEKLSPPLEITEEKVLKEGERITLNGIAVGADEKGNILIFYLPERVPLISTTKIAKDIHSRRADFRFYSFLGSLSENAFKNPERRKKIYQRVKKLLEEIKESRGDIEEDTIRQIVSLFNRAAKEPTPENVEELISFSRKATFGVIKNFLAEEGIYRNRKEDFLVKGKAGYFLRNNPDNTGNPLEDYSKVAFVGIASAPRIIDTQKEGWQVKMVPKAVGMLAENGRILDASADGTVLSKEYRIYKALKPFLTGKLGDQPATINQLKALFGEGLDNFKGLEALKKELSEHKTNVQLVRFIDYAREVIGDALFKEGATVQSVVEEVSKNPVFNALAEGMASFLEERSKNRFVPLSKFTTKVSGSEAVKLLTRERILFRSRETGEIVVNYRAVKEKAGELEEKLGLKVPLKAFARAAASTYNAVEKLRKKGMEFPAEKEAEKVLLHIQTAVSFGERGIKPGQKLIPELYGEPEIFVEDKKVNDKTANEWRKFLAGELSEEELLAEGEEVKEAETQKVEVQGAGAEEVQRAVEEPSPEEEGEDYDYEF